MKKNKTLYVTDARTAKRKTAPQMLAVLGLWLLLSACATVSANPPHEAYPVHVGFPQPGTKWIYRSVNQAGATTTMTFVVLGEGTYEGKPVYRVSAGLDTFIYDRTTANLICSFRMGKEVFVASPHDGTLSSPLWVGKSWKASFTAHDRVRGFSHSPVEVNWKVDAFEEVTVPAGTFQAFRLQSSIAPATAFSTLWYAPELNLIVKRVDERTAHHPLGYEKRVTEMVEYHKPVKTSHRGVI